VHILLTEEYKDFAYFENYSYLSFVVIIATKVIFSGMNFYIHLLKIFFKFYIIIFLVLNLPNFKIYQVLYLRG
jgi:hypothetical protein